MLKRDGLVVDNSGQLPTRLFRDERTFAANREPTSQRSSSRPRGTGATLTECKNVCIARWLLFVI